MKKLHPAYTCLSGGNFDTRGLVGPQEGDLIPPASWVKYPLIAGAGCVLTVTFTMPALPEKATWVLYLSAKKHALLAKNVLVYSFCFIRGVGGFHLFHRQCVSKSRLGDMIAMEAVVLWNHLNTPTACTM